MTGSWYYHTDSVYGIGQLINVTIKVTSAVYCDPLSHI